MDTIDHNVMQAAALHIAAANHHGLPIIHTVTITLNGATGGADVTIEGFTSEDEAVTIESQVSR